MTPPPTSTSPKGDEVNQWRALELPNIPPPEHLNEAD
jgi:hypothetical protein